MCSVTEPSATPLGVDRLSLSFPAGDFERAPRSWSSVQELDPGRSSERRLWGTTERVGEAQVFLGVLEQGATGRVTGKTEFNPSRMVDPEGWGLATPAEAESTLASVLPAIEEFMTPSSPPEHWRLRRLDLAKDFQYVVRPGDTIRALSPIPRQWARRNLVHADPRRHGAQTLMVGSGAGVVRLYDKHAESKGKAPKGTLRWETECRDGWLDIYGGMRLLRDVDDEHCLALAQNRWDWSGMGATVGGMVPVYELAEEAGLTWREQVGFLGWLWAQALGRSPALSKEAKARYRKLQRELGVVVDNGKLEAQHGAQMRRLDWATGREVHGDV